jgi:succinate dehydrogenase / fumarate reductase cytochrome b subunit
MSWIQDLFRSAVGKKAVMALTGLVLFGFVLVHMLGNLYAYAGPKAFNDYAAGLREIGVPELPYGGALWIARIVLLGAALLHIWAAWAVTMESRAARPVGYAKRPQLHTTYASRTLRWGGVILLLFVVYHLLHLTFGVVHPDFQPEKDGQFHAYHNFVTGFSVWWVSAFYIVANVALGLHLYHGVWSLFQSLGWSHPRYNPWRRSFAQAFAWLVTLGNISFPLAVLFGRIR